MTILLWNGEVSKVWIPDIHGEGRVGRADRNLGDPSAVRDVVYVKDVVQAFVKASTQ